MADENVLSSLSRNWKWILGISVVMLVLGVIGLGIVPWLTMANVAVFGALLFLGGAFQIVSAFAEEGAGRKLGHLAIAAIYLVGGYFVIRYPIAASAGLTLWMASLLVAAGIFRLFMAAQARPLPGWGWGMVGGAASIVLGILVLGQWPVSSLWFLGLMFAMELIVQGVWGITAALWLRPRAPEGRIEPTARRAA